MAFPFLILSDIIPFCAATRCNHNPVADDCAVVALERIEPDGSPKRPFALHQVTVSTGSSLTVHQAPALPTAPSARIGVPVKQAQGLHSSCEDDDEPPQLVSGCFEGGDTMAAMCIRRMERKGAATGPPVICWAHVQGLGRGQAASYGALCTNQATAEFNSRRLKEQRKAEASAPPVLIPPIPELDQQRLISSKVSSICFSLYLSSHCGPLQCPGPPRSRHHPSKTTRSQVHLSILVWAAYTTQLILHSVSC
jgi:hypothetical protein